MQSPHMAAAAPLKLSSATTAVAPLRPSDAAALCRVQSACYAPALLESEALYADRLASPAQCSLGVRADGGALQAYLAAYWSIADAVTPLHGAFSWREGADLLYLHDMAVLPACAGRGLAQALLAAAWQAAWQRGVQRAALVSVQGTAAFWRRQGFEAAARQPAALASYGSDAVYMTCTRTAPR